MQLVYCGLYARAYKAFNCLVSALLLPNKNLSRYCKGKWNRDGIKTQKGRQHTALAVSYLQLREDGGTDA